MEPDDRHIANMYTAASEKNLAPVVYIVAGIVSFVFFGWLIWTVMGLAKKGRCFRQCFCPPFWPRHHTLSTVEDGLQKRKAKAEEKEEEEEDEDETSDEEKEKKEVNGDEKRRQGLAGQVKMLLEMINGDTMTTVTEI